MQSESQYSVYVERQGWSDSTMIWLVRRDARGVYNCTIEKGFVVETLVKGGEQPSVPFCILPRMQVDAIVTALTEKITPPKQEAIDAELGATKYHLEDMRKLVFSKSTTPPEVQEMREGK